MQVIHLFYDNDGAKSKSYTDNQLNGYRNPAEQFFVAFAYGGVQGSAP
jgi:hypothetical protein